MSKLWTRLSASRDEALPEQLLFPFFPHSTIVDIIPIIRITSSLHRNEAYTAHALRRERSIGYEARPVCPPRSNLHPSRLSQPPSTSISTSTSPSHTHPHLNPNPNPQNLTDHAISSTNQIPRQLGQHRLAAPKRNHQLCPEREPSTSPSRNGARSRVQQLAPISGTGAVLGAADAVFLCVDELGG